MALAGDEKRAVRDAAVRRLVELGNAGPLSRAQVAQVADGLGVSDRTVWRWVAQASGQVKPVARPQFTLDEVLRKRLAFWRGNESALHREILADAAVSGSPAPSLPTLHRAVREGLAPAERAALRSDESGTIEVVDASTAAGGVTAQADQTGQEPVTTMRQDRMVLPDPGQATTLDDLVQQLRSLKIWAGSPSYETIKDRVNRTWAAAGRPDAELAGKTTVVDCFRLGRRRVNADLLVAIVQALHPDVGYVTQWRQALQVISGQTRAASQVRVQDTLPPAVAEFTGVPLATLATIAEADTQSRYVDFQSFDDGYHESWDIESAMHRQTIVAYAKDGAPLSPAYGAPARVHSPVKLGYKNTKYLTRILFMPERNGGYWTDRGYEWYGGV